MFTLILSACSSAPTVTCTPERNQYFASKEKKYSKVVVRVSSAKEAKAIESGYMSNDELQDYIKDKIFENLNNSQSLSQDGVEVNIDFNVDRIYSWGVSKSMQIFGYSALISLKKQGKVLATFRDSGSIQDNSIAGNFKAVFAKNKPSSEHKYVNVAINSIFAKLPR